MKTRSLVTSILIVCSIVALSSTGCRRGSESDLVQRARLVGQENIELKKELRRMEARIADYESQLKQAAASSDELHTNLMQVLVECEKRAETLAQENERLKQQAANLSDQSQ